MAIHLFLDDMRRCPHGFVAARTMAECLLILESGEVDILSLDFDLGPAQPDGLDVVREMTARKLYAREIYLHSSNMQGRMMMYDLLIRHKPAHVNVFCHPVPDEVQLQIAQSAAASQET